MDEWAEYSDTEDGTWTLVWSWGVDIYTVWAYILTYDYTDTSWNSATQVTRTVIIEDTTPAPASQNSWWGGWYSKRKTDGNLSSSNDVITGQEEFDEWELENIVEDNVEDAPTLDIDVSEENLGEKLKEVDGDMKRYSLHSEYNSCSIIDNLLDENYTNNFETELVDISKSEQKVLIERLEKAWVASWTIEWKFEWDRDISRVEFLKFVLRSHCIEYRNEDASNLEFRDLNNTTWQAKVIKKSLDLWIANGDLDLDWNKIFRADDVISSIEATKILLRMALVQQWTEPITQYKDLEVEWHKNYVQQGEYLWVFNAEEDNYRFSPDDWINRNNTVEFLYKVIRLYR